MIESYKQIALDIINGKINLPQPSIQTNEITVYRNISIFNLETLILHLEKNKIHTLSLGGVSVNIHFKDVLKEKGLPNLFFNWRDNFTRFILKKDADFEEIYFDIENQIIIEGNEFRIKYITGDLEIKKMEDLIFNSIGFKVFTPKPMKISNKEK
jgi:hypothetical protein